MFDDVKRWPQSIPWSVKQWQVAAWVVFVAALVIPAIGPVWQDVHRVQPTLTATQISEAYKDLALRRERATTLGPLYTTEMLERDCYQITAIVSASSIYTSTKALEKLAFDAQELRTELSSLAEKNLRREKFESLPNITSSDRLMALMKADDEIARAIRVGATSAIYRPAFFPPTIPSAIHPSWIGFARWWGFAWLWSSIPAFFFLLGMYRLNQRPVLAELLYRPLVVLASAIFWWFTFNEEFGRGRGALQLRLDRKKWQFCDDHGRDPNEIEVAAMLRQVSGRVLTVEQALARVRETPELVQVRSRRAAFQGLMVVVLSGIGHMITTVATAYAQVTRSLTPTSAYVDTTTTRRREGVIATSDSGNVVVLGDKPKTDPLRLQWVRGYAETRMSNKGTDAITMPTILIEGSAGTTDQFLEWSYSATTRQFLELAAVYKLPPFKLSVGNVWDVIADDAAPPRRALFPGTPVGALVPDWNGIGASGYYDNGGFETSVAVLNTGTPTHRRLDVSGRVSLAHGPFTAAVTAHGGASGSYFAQFVTAKCGRFLGELAHGHRDDLRKNAQSVRFVATAGRNRVGVLIGRPSVYTLSVERRIGGMSRLVGDVSLSRRGPPLFQLRFGTLATTEP